MEQIITSGALVSAPFTLEVGTARTLVATGMAAGDMALVELVTLSPGQSQAVDLCCNVQPGATDVLAAIPLRCANGARVVLTADVPYAVVAQPHGVPLRVRVIPGDLSADVTVAMTPAQHATGACCAACVEPFSASYPLPNGGFGFVAGDMRDPEATVEVRPCGGAGPVVYVFPSPRPGATAPVYSCGGSVVGFAANTSHTPITRAAALPCAA